MDFSMEVAIEQLNALRLHGHHHASTLASGHTSLKHPCYHQSPVSQEEEEEEEVYEEENQQQQQHQQQQNRLEEDFVRMVQEQYETKVQEQQQQVQQIQEQMYLLQEKYKQSEEQNGFLKQALGHMETYYKTVQDQEIVIEELKKQVQQLTLANYRLQLLTQQQQHQQGGGHGHGHGGHGGFMPPSPPDVY